MNLRSRNITISSFVCPFCNNYFPIPRYNGRIREKGHHKDIWCPFCKKKVTTTEIRDRDCYRNMLGEIIE